MDRRGFARGADGAGRHLFIGTDASRRTASGFSRGDGFVELRRSYGGASRSTVVASFRSLAHVSGAQGREGYGRRHSRLPGCNEGPVGRADPHRIRRFLLRWTPVPLARPDTDQLRAYRFKSTLGYCTPFGKFRRAFCRPTCLRDFALERMVFGKKPRRSPRARGYFGYDDEPNSLRRCCSGAGVRREHAQEFAAGFLSCSFAGTPTAG